MDPVFLIEDDLVDALTVKRAFRELEVCNELLHCKNGEEALNFVSKTPQFRPALILLDLNMPKMGGFEFLEEIKQKDLLKDVPVIILTTSTENQDRTLSTEYHVAGYLVKPVDFNNFIEMIRSLSHYLTIGEHSKI